MPCLGVYFRPPLSSHHPRRSGQRRARGLVKSRKCSLIQQGAADTKRMHFLTTNSLSPAPDLPFPSVTQTRLRSVITNLTLPPPATQFSCHRLCDAPSAFPARSSSGLSFLPLSLRCPHGTSSQSTSPSVPRTEFKKCFPVLASPVTRMRNVQCSSTARDSVHGRPPLGLCSLACLGLADPLHHHQLQNTVSLPRLSSHEAFHGPVGRRQLPLPSPSATWKFSSSI